MRVLIIGCGYVGLPLGRKLAALGHEVHGMRRSIAGLDDLRRAGLHAIEGDVGEWSSLQLLAPDFDWVINTAAASGGGPEDYRRIYLQGARNIARWLAGSRVRKYVYTSSTGVYGQNEGQWVTEADPTDPPAETGRILVETERTLFAAARQEALPAVVLRVAGIYGPDRGYYYRQLRQGEARLDGDGSRYVNMIHRDDVGNAIIAALERGTPGEACNVCDDEPVRQRDLYEWLARKMNVPAPEPASDTGSRAVRRGVTNKRISNRKLREEWGCRLTYPTFREGYEAEMKAA